MKGRELGMVGEIDSGFVLKFCNMNIEFFTKKFSPLCTILFVLIFSNLNSQTLKEISLDTLNKLDGNGKKDSYWIVYLNQNLETVKKEKATFFGYSFFIQGIELDRWWEGSGSGKLPIEIKGNKPIPGEIVLLDGEYKIFNKAHSLFWLQHFNKGIKASIEKLYNPSGGYLEYYINYDLKYHAQAHSYFGFEDQNLRGGFRQYWYYRNGEKGWRYYKDDLNTMESINPIKKQIIFYRVDRLFEQNKSIVSILLNDSLELFMFRRDMKIVNWNKDSIIINLIENGKKSYIIFNGKDTDRIYYRIATENGVLTCQPVEESIALAEIKEKKIKNRKFPITILF